MAVYEWISPEHARLRGIDIRPDTIRVWLDIEAQDHRKAHAGNRTLSYLHSCLKEGDRRPRHTAEYIWSAFRVFASLGMLVPDELKPWFTDTEKAELKAMVLAAREKYGWEGDWRYSEMRTTETDWVAWAERESDGKKLVVDHHEERSSMGWHVATATIKQMVRELEEAALAEPKEERG